MAMICFRDMTFCSCKTCDNADCDRNWRLRDNSDYERWSEGFEEGGPLAFSDFQQRCIENGAYIPIKEEK